MEESPEEILARLIRHRDSLARASRPAPPPSPPMPPPVTLVWAPEHRPRIRRGLSAVEATVVGQILATLAGVLGILAFAHLASNVAIVVVALMASAGVAAAARRIPLSLWWTAGVVIGGVLGRWS